MNIGIILVMLAASLWAVDALIRTPLTQTLSPLTIVFWEHVVGLCVLSPVFIKSVKTIQKLTTKDWIFFTILALGSSVGGTLLFTYALSESFSTGDFITPLLLQKLQPIFVILLSSILLKERITAKFIVFAILALVGSYLMSFGLTIPSFAITGKELVVVYALGAAMLWGGGTIISKTVLKKYSVVDATFLRFLIALPVSFLLSMLFQLPITVLSQSDQVLRFVTIALSTGAVGLLLYYFGLKKIPAHVATIAELVFPFVSILIGISVLNPYGAPQILSLIQMIGILILIVSVWKAVSYSHIDDFPQRIRGVVVRGNGDGKKLGFPTANLVFTPKLDIPYGVYAGWITVQNKEYKSAIHYGPRLVFNETNPLLEVHILHFDQEIYGEEMKVKLVTYIRGSIKFNSLDELVEQMKKDVIDANKALNSR